MASSPVDPEDELHFLTESIHLLRDNVETTLLERGWAVRDLGVDDEEPLEWFWPPTAPIGGHSFGGWLAARFALKNPHRTRSLTLLDPAQVFAPFTVRWLLACIRPYLFPSRANVERLMRRLGENRPHHDELVELAVLGMTGFRLRAPEATLVSKRALAGLRVPTQQLIAAGSIVHRPTRAARRAAATAPDVTSRLVRDASHFLFHDRAAVVANAFRSLV